jgi:hypothetical protein
MNTIFLFARHHQLNPDLTQQICDSLSLPVIGLDDYFVVPIPGFSSLSAR